MTHRTIFLAAALVALGPISGLAQQVDAPPAQPAPAIPDIPISQLLEAYGWFLAQRFEANAFDFSDEEIAALNRGIAAAAKGQPAPANIQELAPALDHFLQTRPSAVQERRATTNRAEEAKLFQELDARPAVKKTESGLRYEVLAAGTGAKPTLSDTVVANYKGTFVGGEVFDASERHGGPAEFPLNGVIQGWQEGLQLIGVGGKIKLYVPSKLGYGDTGGGGMPPAKALIFEVELVEVKAAQPTLVTPESAPKLVP